MAITRAKQVRQMLKKGTKPVEQAGVMNYMPSEMVTVPKVAKSSPDHPTAKLAYITDAEKKLLIKKNLHGSLKGKPNRGPGGIPSLQGDFGPGGKDPGGFRSGADIQSAERGDFRGFEGSRNLPPGVQPKPSEEAQALRNQFIAAGGGQRVNPGFFDSRNTVSPAELARAKAFAPRAFAKSRRSGILDFITSGGIIGNLIRGLGQRFGLGKKFNEPTYDMSQFSDLGLLTDRVNPNNLDIYNEFVNDEDDTNIIIPRRKPDTQGLLEVPEIPITPFQKDVEDTQDQAQDDMFEGAMAKLNKIEQKNYDTLKMGKELGLNNEEQNQQLEELERKKNEEASLIRTLVADGGVIGGGIMDAAGRQNYFLGKLVKKATRAVKKIVKSPIGKIGLGALALKFGGGFGAKSPLMNFLFKEGTLGSGLTGKGMLALGGALSAAPLLFGQEEEEQPTGFTGSVGGQIDPRAYTDPQSVLFRAFRAEGGSMKEPVAKRTMPLLDMDGQEMDLRAEGGFVPIGRMEKADDVPARLSKNEFVFTADAVRNAGEGDVDKGAEVMYNMMKNLEAGGDVSEESQGLEGARNMFQTSKRLEDVI